MNIIWHGQSFFEIEVKNKENGGVRLAIDPYTGISEKSQSGRPAEGGNRPYSEEIGLRVPKVQADILLITHSHLDHNNKDAIKGSPFVIEELGEYEIKDVFIKGIPAFHDDKEGKERGQVILYKIEAEGIKVCHLSDLGQKELTPEQVEEIGEIDVLMIPVGSEHSLNAKQASEIISQIEPRVVIPMHYKIPNLKSPVDGVDKFLKVMGAEGITPEKKLKVTPSNLPAEETKIVVLEP